MRPSDSVKISRGFSHTFSSTPVVRSLFNENVPKIRPCMIFSRFPDLPRCGATTTRKFGSEPIPQTPKHPASDNRKRLKFGKIMASGVQLHNYVKTIFCATMGQKYLLMQIFACRFCEIAKRQMKTIRWLLSQFIYTSAIELPYLPYHIPATRAVARCNEKTINQ